MIFSPEFHFPPLFTDKTNFPHFFSVTANAIPGFVKSSVLGSTLFYTYDLCFETMKSNMTAFLQVSKYSFPYYYSNSDTNIQDRIINNEKLMEKYDVLNKNDIDKNNINKSIDSNTIKSNEINEINEIEKKNIQNSYFDIREMGGNTLFVVSFSSFLVGAFGGSVHALTFLTWDLISRKLFHFGNLIL